MPDGGLRAPDVAPYERSGPTFLSEQPAFLEPERRNQADAAEWAILRNHLEQRLISLRTWRNSWWIQNWSDLALFILPNRSIWLTQSAGGWPTPNSQTRGRPVNTAIVDPTATYAARTCAAGLMSGLASPSRPWFKIVPAVRRIQIDAAARIYLDELEDRMYTVLAQSNFYNSFAVECGDITVYGTGPSLMYEDEQDLIRLYNPTVGEYYLGNGGTLRVNTFNRMFVYNTMEAVDFFGAQNTPDDIRSMWKQKGSQLAVERLVAHSIEPNFGVGETDAGKLKGDFSWREVYWVFGKDGEGMKPLSTRGFIDPPFQASRWMTQSNDAYGRSVGMDVLPDVMQLQVMVRRRAEAIEKIVRPPLVADMTLKNQPSSTLPGHVTYVQQLGQNNGMRPIYQINPDLAAMNASIQELQQRIERGLFTDLFRMLESQANSPKKTAYEIAQLINEKLQIIGPVIENLLSDSLKPKLKRLFSILKRKGMIDLPPPSLRNVPLDIQFVSILALAQKAAATGGMEALVKMIGAMAQIYPDAADNLDPDNFVREYSELLGNPQKILRGPEMVAQIRQAKHKQQQQAAASAAAAHTVDTMGSAASAAQTLASTPIGSGKTALGALLGTEQVQ